MAAPPSPHSAKSKSPSRDASKSKDVTSKDAKSKDTKRPPSIVEGIATLKAAVKTLSARPGVYRMLDAAGDALYVGKARNLKKRVTSYTTAAKLTERLARMVSETVSLEVVTTRSEVEALLLEQNMIKKLKPRFNVLLRDDKSFPYIFITGDRDCAQITKYRGARKRPGDYFGPFASAGAVNRTLRALQRAFLLRSCSDGVFAARKRPCLLYQIKRCSAPCVDRISADDYDALVDQARAFLSGRSQEIHKQLGEAMQAASDAQEYEKAANLRDRIRALAAIQAKQDINLEHGIGDADVIAAHLSGGQACVQVFFFRAGRNYGNRAYFPRHGKKDPIADILGGFVGQFYTTNPPPKLVLLSHKIAEASLVSEALSQRAEAKVTVIVPQRGDKKKLIDHALANARDAHARRLAESASQRRLLEGVAETFGLDGVPERIEVYDNSHISGTNAVGAMVVAGPDGFVKNAYRKFNIKDLAAKVANDKGDDTGDDGSDDAPKPPGLSEQAQAGYHAGPGSAPITPGDDYAMMRQVLTRRFARALKEDPERESGNWPDLVMIDGGPGQLSVARAVLDDLGVDDVALVAIAKGPDRDAGRERFFRPDQDPISLEADSPVLYFLQRLRDEAHRFAIGAHRAKRSKAIGQSLLDDVPGIGARRKRALLLHFGSAKAVAKAGLADLEAVDGISGTVARKIYDHFNTQP
jgi:excinuclease ABC subunit C